MDNNEPVDNPELTKRSNVGDESSIGERLTRIIKARETRIDELWKDRDRLEFANLHLAEMVRECYPENKTIETFIKIVEKFQTGQLWADFKAESDKLKADAERTAKELKIKADRVIQLELENRQIRGENATLRLSNEEYYEDKKTHRDWSEMATKLKKENELLLDANKLVNEKCEVLRDENQQFRADNAELLKVHKQMVERFDDSLKRGLMLVRSIENLSATVARLTADK
jgi:hypothetical protein